MRYTSKNLYAVEEADRHPVLIDYLKQQININLSSAIFVEAEKGDVIVHFGEFEMEPQTEIYCQSIRRVIDINPLIRCKDCKHRYSYACCNFAIEPQDDDYCSRAERREE